MNLKPETKKRNVNYIFIIFYLHEIFMLISFFLDNQIKT